MNLLNKNVLFSRNNNFWEKHRVKIASTFIATTVWFFIVTGGTFDYEAPIQITCPGTRNDYIVTNDYQKTGKVLLRGQGIHLLTYLLFNEGKLRIEPNWEPGLHTIHPTLENISLSGNAKKISVLKYLEPDSLQLNIEKLETKSVKVKTEIFLKPQNGFTIVDEVKVEPEEVLIRAPKSMIDSIDTIQSKRLELSDLKYPIERQLELIDPQIQHLDLLTTKVTVSADVQKLMEKQINNITVKVKNLPPNVTALVIPSNLSLVVQGGVNVVFPINETDIDAYIDYQKQRPNSQQNFPAYIKPLPGVRFTNIEPQRFKIILKRD